jgi:hypothetical protein
VSDRTKRTKKNAARARKQSDTVEWKLKRQAARRRVANRELQAERVEFRRLIRAFLAHGNCEPNADADDYPKLERDARKALAQTR